MIPYSKQTIEQADIDAVVATLQSGWLTTGPKIDEFENKIADFVGVDHVVAVNSGTAALHAMLKCSGVGEGDEVIVPAISFVATANAVLFCGAKPVFADIDPESFLICPDSVESLTNSRTKAVVAVDFAGHPCDYERLREICTQKDCYLFSDSSHALGATWKTKTVADWVDACVYSFHPVKPLTTCEGGAIATDHPLLAKRMQRFRNHGIDLDHRERIQQRTWSYDMKELGFNYRISDLQCALGIAQLDRLHQWQKRRREVSQAYDQFFCSWNQAQPQAVSKTCLHAHHLYPVCLESETLRDRLFGQMRDAGVGVNVHYRPIYLHSYYRNRLGYAEGLCPTAESVASRILSLPVFPTITDEQIQYTISVFQEQTAKLRVAA